MHGNMRIQGKKLLFMGSEFGQWLEWNEAVELDWNLVSFPAHDAIRKLIHDLNKLYQQEPALHQFDHDPRGFRWLDCDDANQSTLSLMRLGEGDEAVIIALNFTPVPRHHFRVGVPAAAAYEEILNTDSAFYGGSNCGNQGRITVQAQPHQGFEQSLDLTLPPLGAIFLRALPRLEQPLSDENA